jgi:2-polyprenyl-3-methyl-5-hydroxy-6-metoxy-1,4-benzoquinol methylase
MDEQCRAYNEAFAKGDGYSRDARRFTRYFEHLVSLGVDPQQTRVLDVGCGPGPLEVYLYDRGFRQVEAVDYAEEGIKRAKTETPGFNYRVADIEELTSIYESNSFDLVFCLQVLEHLDNYMQVIQDMISLLDEKGVLMLSVPWDHCKDNEWHVNHFLPADFERIAQSMGMTLITTERFGENDLQLLAIMRRRQ